MITLVAYLAYHLFCRKSSAFDWASQSA